MKTNKKKNILIVDDDPKIRKVVADLLEQYYDLKIFEAGNGIDGISMVLENNISAIITDLDMPEMTGLEFLGFLKVNFKLQEIPVVFLTSYSDNYHKDKAVALGAHTYLSKPLDITDLKKTIDKIFNFNNNKPECHDG